MNKMKKVLALLLALVMVFSLSACGKKSASEEKPAASEKTEKTEQTVKAEASKDMAAESAASAEGEKAAAKETAKPAETEKPSTEEILKENASVGVAEGDGTENIEGGDYVVPPQVNVPAEDAGNDEPVVITMDIYDITYDMYNAMSAAEQQAVMELFGSTEDFMVWLNYVKAEYEADHPAIEVGPGGVVDLS